MNIEVEKEFYKLWVIATQNPSVHEIATKKEVAPPSELLQALKIHEESVCLVGR